jgi:hypothetical protein
MQTPKYKIGDWVRVIRTGYTYSAYEHMFTQLGFRDTNRNDPFARDTIAQVFGCDEHENNDQMLYALRDLHGGESLVDDRGLTEADMYVKTWDDTCRYDSEASEMYVTLDVAEPERVEVVRIRNPDTGTHADFTPVGMVRNQWSNMELGIVLTTNGIVWNFSRNETT